MFHCVFLALASQEERVHRSIVLRVWNIFSSEFILFFYSFLMLDARRQVQVKYMGSQMCV